MVWGGEIYHQNFLRCTLQSVIKQRVLVLNRHWTPLGVVTVRRAVVLMLTIDNDRPKAMSLSEDLSMHDWESWSMLDAGPNPIRSSSRSFRPPSVLISRTDALPRLAPAFTKRAMFRRDKHSCLYCGSQYDLTIDHVLPRSQGGGNGWTNCVTACYPCNHAKGDRTPEQAGMKLLCKPVRPSSCFIDEPYPEFWRQFLPK